MNTLENTPLIAVRNGRLIISLWLALLIAITATTVWWIYFRDRSVEVGDASKWTVVLDICKAGECETSGFSNGMQMQFPYDYTRLSHHLLAGLPLTAKRRLNTLDKKESRQYYWLDGGNIRNIVMNFIAYHAEFTEPPVPYATANATQRGHYAWTKNSRWNKSWAQYVAWDGNRAQLTISKGTKSAFDKRLVAVDDVGLGIHEMELRAERVMGMLWYQPQGQSTPGHLEFFVDDTAEPNLMIKCKQPTSAADIRSLCKMRSLINDDLEIEVSFPRSLLPKWRQLERSLLSWLRSYLVSELDMFYSEPY